MNSFRAPVHSTCSATPLSKAPRLRPSWVTLPASFRKPNKVDQDASGRLMQPTLSKTSTHTLCSERRAATVKPRAAAGLAFQYRRAHLLPADPAGPQSVIDSAWTHEGWILTPRHRLDRSARTKRRTCPRDRDRLHHRPIEERWIPDPRRLPPVGSSVEPSAGSPGTMRARAQLPTPLHPLRVTASG